MQISYLNLGKVLLFLRKPGYLFEKIENFEEL